VNIKVISKFQSQVKYRFLSEFQAQLSDSGSNLHAAENVVYSWWLDYLQQIEGCDCCPHSNVRLL